MSEFVKWVKKEKFKLILFVLIDYIPLWIIISGIWQKDGSHVNLKEFLLIQGLVVAIHMLLIFGIYKFSTRSDRYGEVKLTQNPSFGSFISAIKSSISDFIDNQNHKDEMYIEDLGWVKKCCNQTARLGERYCVCGRAVTKELYQLYLI